MLLLVMLLSFYAVGGGTRRVFILYPLHIDYNGTSDSVSTLSDSEELAGLKE